MQLKPRTRLIVSLLCLLTLAALWGWLQRQPATAPSADTATPGTPNAQPAAAVAPGTTPLLSGLRPGAAAPVTAPARTNANEEPFPYRLRNTPRTLADLMRDDAALMLRNALIDSRQPLNLAIPAHLRAEAEPGAYVVQARAALNDSFRKQLTDAGATIVSYVPNNALLVRMSAADAQRLAALPQTQSVVPWEPYFKLAPRLLTAAVEQRLLPTRTVFNVLVFAGQRDAAVQSLAALGAQVAAEDRSPFGTLLTVSAPETALVPMAKLPTVQGIEPYARRQAANDLTRARVKISTNTVTAQNYLDLKGTGIRVGVNDTGVDAGHVDLAPRVSAADPDLLVDPQGHGTHVAGIIASSGQNGPDGSKVPGSFTNSNYRGMAPEAGIYALPINIIFGPLAGDTYLQEQTALTNILISNNSWGYRDDLEEDDEAEIGYSLAAASWDAAVRDALPGVSGPQPLVAVFSAGNSGAGGAAGTGGRSGSITSPGTAKNVITVGAVENYRHITNEVTGGSDPGARWYGITDSSNQVASFSSRGNVGRGKEGPFGRFKPDVVAPGTMVVSTRSSQWSDPVGEAQPEFTSISSQILSPGSTNNYSIFVPNNALQLVIEVRPNRLSPASFPDLPIFAAANQRPGPGNQVGINIATINNPAFGVWFYSVVNPEAITVHFDLRIMLVLTNDSGDYFTVLKELNDVLAPNYRYESGTSQSAAVVSGMLALMQQHFEQTLQKTNSPALMKALLINGARTASTGNPTYDFAVHNYLNFQGWGLPNITNTLPAGLATGDAANGSMVYFDQDASRALATGQSFTRTVTVDTAGLNSPLRFTLVWTDPPGNPAVGIKLVNDLDLIVTNLTTGSTGAVYVGNSFESGNVFSTAVASNSVPDFDLVNNVENVFLDRPLNVGTYSVTVRARRVNVNAVNIQTNGTQQDFALVISSGNPGAQLLVTVAAPTATWEGNPSLKWAINGHAMLNERVGGNYPLLSSTNGITNQWNFYIVTNRVESTNTQLQPIASNIAFATFMPQNLSRPRNFTADIDLYVSADPRLTNLDTAVIASSARSVHRGGTEMVVLSDVPNTELFYAAVKSEDQQAANYGFFAVSSMDPFTGRDENGNITFHGYPVGALIPDGDAAEPGGTNIIAFCTESAKIQNVVVENTLTIFDTEISHEPIGDLFGVLSHQDTDTQAEPYVVLNNHRAFYGTQTWIYDESDDGEIPDAIPPDGPGSLRDFAGDEAMGVWQFTVTDNALEFTGRVDSIVITVQPEPEDLLNGTGITATILPNKWERHTVDVPPNATNLMVCVSPDAGPVAVYLRFGADPTLTQYDAYQLFQPPGGCLNLGRRDSPPLTTGRWYIGVYNPGNLPVVTGLTPFVQRGAVNNSTFNFRASGSTTIFDDAVTNSGIFVNQAREVADVSVGVRIDHERVSDLVLHLISPSGTRVMLAENRGGPYGTNYGAGVLTTNSVQITPSGGAAAQTNIIVVPSGEGTLEVNYEFYGIPDFMTVYYDGQLIFDSGLVSGQGNFSVDFGPGLSTNLVIVMNEGDNSNQGTAWNYKAEVVSGILYATFTENTNLTTTLIKFAVPPFAPTNPSPIQITDFPIGDFEGQDVGPYLPPSILDGWTVLNNEVDIDSAAGANTGNQYVALKTGAITRQVPATIGTKYRLEFAQRAEPPPALCWRGLWPGDGNTNDLVSTNNATLQITNVGRRLPAGLGYGPGIVGGESFAFYGSNYVMVPASPTIDIGQGGGFSVAAWVRPSTNEAMPILEWSGNGSSPGNPGVNIWMSRSSPLDLQADIVDTTGNSHILSLPNALVEGAFQYVVLTYDTSGEEAILYIDGLERARMNFGTAVFMPDTTGNLLFGLNPRSAVLFNGYLDEISIHDCVLSSNNVQSLYDTGRAGLPSYAPPGSAAAGSIQTTIDGVVTTTPLGTNWTTITIPFIANSASIPIQFSGTSTNAQLDSVVLQEIKVNGVYYLAEESLSPFIGENARGLWRLEIWDNRIGGTTTNAALLSWKLNISFGNTNYAATVLTNCTTQSGVVADGETDYYYINVPLSARHATNHLFNTTAGLDLLFNTFGLPQGNLPGDYTLLNDVTDGIAVIATNGTTILDPTTGAVLATSPNPRLIPGRRYYLGVSNPQTAGDVNYDLEVCFDRLDPDLNSIIPLTNGVENCRNQGLAPGQMEYFQFNVPTNGIATTFSLSNITGGNADLYITKELPTPLTNFYYAASTNLGTTNEIIQLTDYSFQLLPGRWYVGVYNNDIGPVTYCVFATNVTGKVFNIPPVGLTNYTSDPGSVTYYRVDIFNNAWRADFIVTNNTAGDVDLYNRSVAAGPLILAGTAPTNFMYASINPGTLSELIIVSNTAPPPLDPLTPGPWMMAVVNTNATSINYDVGVVQYTNPLPNYIILTNFVARDDNFLANANDYFQFTVLSNPVQVVFETYGANGAAIDLYVTPNTNYPPPGPANFVFASANAEGANEYIVITNGVPISQLTPGIWYLTVTNLSGAAANYTIRARAYYESDFVPLTNAIAYSTSIAASNSPVTFGFNYYRFDVSSNAFQARFETFGASNNLTLLVQKGLPLTNENNFTYQTNLPPNGNRVIDVLTNSTPVNLGPGTWYMAVFNPNAFAVPYSARVTEFTSNQIIRLTNSLAYSNTVAPQLTTRASGIDYYLFTVSTGAFQATFEITNAVGNVDLYATKGLPIPAISGFPFSSTNAGTTNEMILVLPGSTPPLSPGDWYLAVVNRELTNVAYEVRATEWTTNSMVTLTNEIAFTNDTAVPGPTTEFYRFVVTNGAIQANFQLDALTGRADLYVRYGPPLTNILNWPLASTNGGTNSEWIVVNPGSTPVPLLPGDWYLAVVNLETNSIHYRVTASMILSNQIMRLTPNTTPVITNATDANPVFSLGRDFYVFNVSTSAFQVDCLMDSFGANLDLYVSRNLPLPGTPSANYSSTTGNPDEWIQLNTNSTPYPLAPGDWYLTVVNREPAPSAYQVSVIQLNQARLTRLINGVAVTNSIVASNAFVPYSGIEFYVFNVSSNAVQATFETLAQIANVDLYVSPRLPLPGPTNAVFVGTNLFNTLEWIAITTNSAPPLTPGDWFVAIVNREAYAVDYALRASEVLAPQIVTLTNGVVFSNTIAASSVPLQLGTNYYAFNVSSGAVQAVFESFGASNNVDLYLRYQLPLPDPAHFDYASTNLGNTNEWIPVTDGSSPVALTNGPWFLAVVNRETNSTAYAVRATEVLASQITTLTNGLAFTNTIGASTPPLRLRTDYYVFNVSSGAVQTIFETLGTSNNVDLFLSYQLPLPDVAHFDYASTRTGNSNEWLLLTNGSSPVSLTNGPWYLTIVNRTTNQAAYAVRATEVTASEIVNLTNGVMYSNLVSRASVSTTTGVDYYVFTVSPFSYKALFEVFNASGNIDIYLRRGLPLPSASLYDYHLFDAASPHEVIRVTTNSAPVPLAYGDWYVTVVNRATNSVSYEMLASEFGPTNWLTTLTNGQPAGGTLPPRGGSNLPGHYYVFNVSPNAVSMTVDAFPTNGDVNIYLTRDLPPPSETYFFYASTNGGTSSEQIVVTTNSAPYPLRPGDWYLLVSNPGTNAVDYSVRVTEVLAPTNPAVALTNGIPYAGTLADSTVVTRDYYVFTVSANAQRAQFEVLQPSGDVSLAVRKGLPLPDESSYDYLSNRPGTGDELIVLYQTSAPVPLSPGDWYLTVSRLSPGPVTYNVKATEYPTTGTNFMITRTTYSTNSLCLTWGTTLPGAHYFVQGRTSLNDPTWVPVSPPITATGAETTWCLPLPSNFTFFRISEGLAVPSVVPPQLPIGGISMTGGAFRFAWPGPTNQNYRAEWTATLTPGSWLPIPGVITSANGMFVFIDDGSQQTGGLGPKRFYRFILLP